MDLLLILLRLIHVLFGVFWAGSMFFMVSFLLPTAREAGPAGAPFMRRFARSGFTNAAAGSAVLTVLSGLGLFWMLTKGNTGFIMGSGRGITLSIGALAAIVALIYGLVVQRPVGTRMATLAAEVDAAGGVPNEAQMAEMPGLQARLVRGLRIIAVLLLIAVACMAMARYVVL
jgi:hypothetical protein